MTRKPITSRELIKRCGGDPDKPLTREELRFPSEMRMRPATDEEAQRGLNDTWPGDPYPTEQALERETLPLRLYYQQQVAAGKGHFALAELLAEAIAALANESTLCEDCPPSGYPTDKTRCSPCPRRGRA